MPDSISRRNFLKASSVTGLSAAVLGPSSSFAKPKPKVRVVIAKDPECLNGNSPVESKIQDMVDYSVMHMNLIGDKGLAYEAIFSDTVSSSTKIMLKRNDISGKRTVNGVTIGCMKKGLTNMLDGNYSESRVTIMNRNADASGTISQNDYIINCPVAWCHGSSYGVTLSLKNTMGYLDRPSRVHSQNKRWLHENSLHSSVKPKQMMSMMDAIEGNNSSGPGSSPDFKAHTIIMSKDIVAVDYNTIELMGDQSSPSTSRLNTGKSQLQAAQSAGLGTCTPSEMEIIRIEPPWEIPVGIHEFTKPVKHANNVQVFNRGNRVEFTIPSANNAQISVFNLKGKLMWQARNITSDQVIWRNNSLQGAKVPAGIYTYQINHKGASSKGTISVIR